VALCIAAAVLLAGDLVMKWWAFAVFPEEPVSVSAVMAGEQMMPRAGAVVVPNVLAINLVLNRGAVFGLGQGYTWLFVLVTVIAVGAIGWTYARSEARHWLLHITLTLVLAGALGNLYDRIVFGAVRDMLWLFPGVNLPFGWSWGGGQRGLYPWVFNLADVYLTCGIGLLILRALFVRHPMPESAETGDAPQ